MAQAGRLLRRSRAAGACGRCAARCRRGRQDGCRHAGLPRRARCCARRPAASWASARCWTMSRGRAQDWYAQMRRSRCSSPAATTPRATSPRLAQRARPARDPFRDLLRGRGPGLQGLPAVERSRRAGCMALRGEAGALLGMPAFGFAREHRERAQALRSRSCVGRDALAAWQALMGRPRRTRSIASSRSSPSTRGAGQQQRACPVRPVGRCRRGRLRGARAVAGIPPRLRRAGECADAPARGCAGDRRTGGDADGIASRSGTRQRIARSPNWNGSCGGSSAPADDAPSPMPPRPCGRHRQAGGEESREEARQQKKAVAPAKRRPGKAAPAPVKKQAAKPIRPARTPASSTSRRKR